MKLSIGIIGLPNVGKSTLFNALLKKQVADVSNYPFCTIEPNVGVVEVPDERLKTISKTVGVTKIVPAVVEFFDIAGLVKGASKGEGLGNKFLSHIREVAAIAHVVRLFEDQNVIHVTNKVDPLSDIQTIESELILADLETVSKSKIKYPSSAKATAGEAKQQQLSNETIEQLKTQLNQGITARNVNLTNEQKDSIKHLNLLTIKPQIFVFNVSEKQLENQAVISNQLESVKSVIHHDNYLFLNAKLENDVLALNETEQKEYLQQYNLRDSGLNRLIKKAHETLGLISFFTTTGNKEVRAWTLRRGDTAFRASSVIHTDFAKHFVRADVIPWSEFVAAGGWTGAREKGKVQTVGKDYIVKDGDVIEFKVGT